MPRLLLNSGARLSQECPLLALLFGLPACFFCSRCGRLFGLCLLPARFFCGRPLALLFGLPLALRRGLPLPPRLFCSLSRRSFLADLLGCRPCRGFALLLLYYRCPPLCYERIRLLPGQITGRRKALLPLPEPQGRPCCRPEQPVCRAHREVQRRQYPAGS